MTTNMRAMIATALMVSAGAEAAWAAHPPKIDASAVHTYKTVGDVELKLWVFEPEGHKASDKRPAIVFFFGGGWVSGSPTQFVPHCEYLASRGMVAMVADYRVKSRNQTTPFECVKDGRSAVRWIRTNAAELGVDPQRIAAGGGSAGGHVAAATAVLTDINEEGEPTDVSAEPNALALFNPGLVIGDVNGEAALSAEMREKLKRRFGASSPTELSPYHHLRAGLPPTIIFTGEADTTTPLIAAELYTKRATELGNRCELVTYPGEKHGFFNRGRGGDKAFIDTVRRMDLFLASLGWLEGEPTIGG